MNYAEYYITDGTTEISFLRGDDGFWLTNLKTETPTKNAKTIWQTTPWDDGRRLVQKRKGHIIDQHIIRVSDCVTDELADFENELLRLLEKAVEYWTEDGQDEPVYLVKKSSDLSNRVYATITDYSIPNLESVFSQPFVSNKPVDTMDLFIEHTAWQSSIPNTGDCLQISGLQEDWHYVADTNLVQNPGFETAGGGGADVFADWTENAGSGAIADEGVIVHSGSHAAKLTAGALQNTYLRHDINVTAGECYTLTLWTRGDGTYAGYFRLYDDTNGEEIVRLQTTEITGTTYTLFHIHFVAPTGCTTIRLYLYGPETNGGVAYFDDITLNTVTSTNADFGRVETCDNEVYISNAHKKAQLTHIFRYDHGTTLYSVNLIGTYPYNLWPNSPEADDAVYFIIDSEVCDSGPFNSLVFDIGTIQVNVEATWEYYNGAGWTAITYYRDNTNADGEHNACVEDGEPFDTLGVKSVHWQIPTNWAITTVNGVTGYIVRCRVTGTTGATTPPRQISRDVYTINWACIDVADDIIHGETEALLKIVMENVSDRFATPGECCALGANKVIISSRTLSRGACFSPWLFAGNSQNPDGVTVEFDATGWTALPYFATQVSSPTGLVVKADVSDAHDDDILCKIILDSTIANQYYGTFMIWALARQTGGGVDDVTFGLNIITSSGDNDDDPTYNIVDIDPSTYSTGGGGGIRVLTYLDTVTIAPTGLIDTGLDVGRLEFIIPIDATGDATSFEFESLILMPVDEWCGEFESLDDSFDNALLEDKALVVDTLRPKRQLISYLEKVSEGIIAIPWSNKVNDYANLDKRKEQRLWFFNIANNAYYSFAICNLVDIDAAMRWITNRGTN